MRNFHSYSICETRNIPVFLIGKTESSIAISHAHKQNIILNKYIVEDLEGVISVLDKNPHIQDCLIQIPNALSNYFENHNDKLSKAQGSSDCDELIITILSKLELESAIGSLDNFIRNWFVKVPSDVRKHLIFSEGSI